MGDSHRQAAVGLDMIVQPSIFRELFSARLYDQDDRCLSVERHLQKRLDHVIAALVPFRQIIFRTHAEEIFVDATRCVLEDVEPAIASWHHLYWILRDGCRERFVPEDEFVHAERQIMDITAAVAMHAIVIEMDTPSINDCKLVSSRCCLLQASNGAEAFGFIRCPLHIDWSMRLSRVKVFFMAFGTENALALAASTIVGW